MKNLKKIILTGVTVTVVAVGASAFAQRGEGGHQGRMVERISSKLELTDTQSAALATFAEELAQTRELMRGTEGTDLRSQMQQLVTAETFDQGQALTLINERAAAVQAKAPALVAAAAVFFDGLTAEQKARIQEFAEKRGHRHGDRAGRNGDDD
jgi:Spy/CpxP family protein refolding chaperone